MVKSHLFVYFCQLKMENIPLISIIMPCYNAEQFVAESIDSVLAQTYQNWELVVTDDNSSDSTPEIVRNYCEKDNRIKLYLPGIHQGIAQTRNHSLSKANGRFVAFLDNDDLWVPTKLEHQVQFMLDNNLAFCYGNYELLNEDGTKKRKVIRHAGVMNYNKYLHNTIIGSGTVMIDTEKTGSLVMPLNETSDDMALWCHLLKNGYDAYPINEIILLYRVRNTSASSNKLKAAKDVWMVYRQQEKLSFFKSLDCFLGYAFNSVKKRL